MKEKILYLTVLENTLNNSIHKNQILVFENNNFVENYFLFISPLFILNRKGFSLNNNKFKLNNVYEIKIPFLSYNFLLNIFLIPFLLLFSFPILFLFFRRYKFKIVHCRNLISSFLAVIFRKLFFFQFKIISDPRSLYPEEGVIVNRWKYNSYNYKAWKIIEKYTFKNSDYCIGLSNFFCDYLKKYNVNSVYIPAVVNNSIAYNHELREIGRKEYHLKEDDLLFIYVGSIGLWHKMDILINMFDNIISTFRKYNCKIIVLTDSDSLKTLVANKYSKNCLLADRVSTDSVHKFLCMSDFGLLPGSNEDGYHYEMLYKTMLSSKAEEYLCAGLPIISNSRISEMSILINNLKCGYLFNSKDSKLENDSSATFSISERQDISTFARKEFSFHSVINRLNFLYKKLL